MTEKERPIFYDPFEPPDVEQNVEPKKGNRLAPALAQRATELLECVRRWQDLDGSARCSVKDMLMKLGYEPCKVAAALLGELEVSSAPTTALAVGDDAEVLRNSLEDQRMFHEEAIVPLSRARILSSATNVVVSREAVEGLLTELERPWLHPPEPKTAYLHRMEWAKRIRRALIAEETD